jgi:hypothetical protein
LGAVRKSTKPWKPQTKMATTTNIGRIDQAISSAVL